MAKYIWQPLMLLLFLTGVLLFFYWHASSNVLWAVGAGSLASSAYIVFGKPSANAGKAVNIFVGYVIAICVGIFFRFFVENALMHCSHFFQVHDFCWPGIIAAISVVVSLLLMAAVHVEHPPAAGLSLILVLDVQDYQTLIIIFVSVVVLVFLKLLLKPWMRDLF